MQKNTSKALQPWQGLVALVILAAVAFLRSQGYGVSPIETALPSTPLPHSQAVLSPSKTPAASAPKPSRTPKPANGPTPTVLPAGALNLADKMSQFDYFVLALSWSPDYCAANGSSDPQQCSLGKKLGFVLHGLWPQNQKGYPSNCTDEKMPASAKVQFQGLYPNDSLFDHEWDKHGTCTGLSPVEYLQLGQELKAAVTIPNEFRSPAQPFRTSPDKLKALFTQANPGFSETSFEVSCSGSGRYLKEIYVCFAREGSPTACSAEMHKTALKSCQAADFQVRNTR
jgi:ribonuclease T2